MQFDDNILPYLPMAVILFDAEGRFLAANPLACQLFALDPEADQRKMCQLLLPDLNIANCSPGSGVTQAEMAKKPLGLFLDGKVVLTRRGQKIFCRSVYLPEEAPGPGRIVLLAEDMADNCNLAGRILEEERLMGVTEISNTMAHKLNQYLQVIMGYISLMTLEMEPQHPCYEYLNKILEQLENIRVTTHLLSNINRYAVIERPDGRRLFDLDRATGELSESPTPPPEDHP